MKNGQLKLNYCFPNLSAFFVMNVLRTVRPLSFSGIHLMGCILLVLIAPLANSKNLRSKIAADHVQSKTNSTFSLNQASILLPYFPKIYSGVGIEHMNINLVNLKLTGLKTGDEIGVFDGKYCVGSGLVTDNHMLDNSLNIPTSANDSILSSPNGFIDGHKISLKVYRSGKVYLLWFQTVNNSQDIFESRGSMFAFVDFSKSTGNRTTEILENVNIFPNPFSTNLHIKINLSNKENIKIEVFDLNGKIIRSIHEGKVEGELKTVWDGKDSGDNRVPPGVYICRINQSHYRIIYQGH